MELSNRAESETRFAANLARSFTDYRARLEPYLSRGEPIPQNVWSEIETDMRQKLTALLLLLFVASATQHGLDASAAEAAGLSFAGSRAKEVAGQFVANSQSRLAGPAVDSANADGLLARMFSPDRAADIAATETTLATSAGGESGTAATVGLSEFDLWFTAADNRVCKVCGPLHATKRSTWQARFPQGPPGHTNCRCYIEYVHERN